MATAAERILAAWDAVGRWRPAARRSAKAAAFAAILFFALFPYPHQFVRQVGRWIAFDALIDPAFVGVDEANAAIDAMLGDDAPPMRELAVVQRYVYDRIAYDYDWDNWGAFDYWPTAQEAWDLGREDCDGQAIVAASILRSRGHADATIVGNMQHMWVRLGQAELMGPQATKGLERRPDGTVRVALPDRQMAFAGLAFTLDEFPTARLLAPLVAFLLLAWHPRRSGWELFALLAVFAAGFILLRQWAIVANATRSEAGAVTPRLATGAMLCLAALAGGPALGMLERVRKTRSRRLAATASN